MQKGRCLQYEGGSDIISCNTFSGGFMQVHLRPRLLAAASFLAASHTVADIGCDHGRLSAALVQRGLAKHVLASDISEDSLQKAKDLACRCGFSSEQLSFFVSDGLSHLVSGEADALVFAGMGGELIARLLEEGKEIAHSAKRIVMQPMGGTKELRKYLYENGYTIKDEAMVLDAGRYYQILLASPNIGHSAEMPSDAILEFGAILFAKRDPLLREALICCVEGRRRRMQRAEKDGVIPPQLVHELTGAEMLLSQFDQEEQQ